MSPSTPRFNLYLDSQQEAGTATWRFILEAADGSTRLEAADIEAPLGNERLALLAAVRGLEALDQPSRVTMSTGSRYVSQGMAHGLDDWRGNGWTWESFGQMVPVKDRDLWQRLDRALEFHRVDVRQRRIDDAHREPRKPTRASIPVPHMRVDPPATGSRPAARVGSRFRTRRVWLRCRRAIVERANAWRLSLAQLGLPGLLPRPWFE